SVSLVFRATVARRPPARVGARPARTAISVLLGVGFPSHLYYEHRSGACGARARSSLLRPRRGAPRAFDTPRRSSLRLPASAPGSVLSRRGTTGTPHLRRAAARPRARAHRGLPGARG